MATMDPTFDGWALSSVGFVATRAGHTFNYPARPRKAAMFEGGVSPIAGASGRTIRLSGGFVGTTPSGVNDNYSTLIKNLRGSNRDKRGKLDLYGDGKHIWAELVGVVPFDHRPGVAAGGVALDFYAADPWWRADTQISVVKNPSSSSPSVTLTYNTDFDGDAPRIPISINATNLWLFLEKIRIHNSTAGWRFEHIITENLAGGSNNDLVIDGEQGEVYEGSRIIGEGVAGVYPYIIGGVSNVLDFTGSDQFNATTFTFWDRFF